MAEATEHIRILLDAKTDAANRAMRRSAAEILRLEQAHDPLVRAQVRLLTTEKQIAAAVANGTITVERQKEMLARAKAQYDEAAAGVARLKAAQTTLGSATGNLTDFMARNRTVMQQAGYQIGDFAIQVGGGVNPMIAFAQQGSQMLGVFGAFGAVFGAALAISAPFISSMFKTADAAKAAEDRIKALNDALSAFTAAQNAVRTTTFMDLAGTYGGEYAQQARDLLELQEALAALDLQKELDALSEMIGADAFGDFGGRTAAEFRAAAEDLQALHDGMQRFREDFEAAEDQVERNRIAEEMEAISNAFNSLGGRELQPLIDQLGLTAGAAAEVAAAMIDLRDARGATEQAAAMEQLRTALRGAVGDMKGMTDDARLLYDQLINGETAALRLAAAGALIAQSIGGAANEAARLGSNLDYAARVRTANIAANSGDDERGSQAEGLRDIAELRTKEALGDLKIRPDGSRIEPPKGRKGGGGGRGGRNKLTADDIGDRELAQMQRRIELLGKTAAQAAELTAKWRMLDDAKRAGLDLDARHIETGRTLREEIDAQAASIGVLAEQYEQAQDRTRALEDLQGDLKDAILDMADGGGDALDNLIEKLKRAALEALLFRTGPLADIFKVGATPATGGTPPPAGGGGLVGAIGGFLGGLFGKRASGGPVESGRPYLVNENTPRSEVFVPSRSGAILNVPQAQAALRGAADGGKEGVAKIELLVDAAPGVTVQMVRQEAAGVAVEVVAENNRRIAQRQRRN